MCADAQLDAKVMPDLVRESAKPLEAIESIKIVQVDGLTNGGKGGSGGAASVGGGSGNLATDAVSAALAYRAQAPVLDGLMKELGLDGSSLNSLVKGPAEQTAGLAVEAEDEMSKPEAKAEKKALPASGKPKGSGESKPAEA